MKQKLLVVGGTWGDKPKASGYISQLVHLLSKHMSDGWLIDTRNGTDGDGGSFATLKEKVIPSVVNYDCIIWAANVDNSEEKLITQIKKLKPSCTLVETKRNYGKYSDKDLIAHMLKNHASLMLELDIADDRFVYTRILDPLGNLWLDTEYYIDEVARTLSVRINQLRKFTRLASVNIGAAREVPQSAGLAEFIVATKKIGVRLHEFVHGVSNPDRFLGNYAFRCLHGFPAVREAKRVFVSPRNIDKRCITTEDLVEVEAVQTGISEVSVGYYGDRKPSVDAPIQLGLFNNFDNIKYMLHTHAYITDAPFSQGEIIPCGSLEEVDAFTKNFDANSDVVLLNLRGHGSMIMLGEDKLHLLEGIKFTPRPFLENASYWAFEPTKTVL